MHVFFQVKDGANKHLMTLRADRRALYIQKSFPVNIFNKITTRIQTTAATSYEGQLDGVTEFSTSMSGWTYEHEHT